MSYLGLSRGVQLTGRTNYNVNQSLCECRTFNGFKTLHEQVNWASRATGASRARVNEVYTSLAAERNMTTLALALLVRSFAEAQASADPAVPETERFLTQAFSTDPAADAPDAATLSAALTAAGQAAGVISTETTA